MKKKTFLTTLFCIFSMALLCFGIAACDNSEAPSPDPDPEKTTYKVTTNYDTSQGTITLDPANEDGKYEENAKITVTVTANEGFTIDTFTVSTDSSAKLDESGKYMLTITGDTTIKATFKATGSDPEEKPEPVEKFTLTYSQPEHGKIAVTPGATDGKYAKGTDITVTLTPDEGYEVDTFKVDGEDKTGELQGNVYTFGIAKDTVIAATFKVSSDHEHVAAEDAEWKIDEEKGTHYKECKICGVRIDEAEHAPQYSEEWEYVAYEDEETGTHYQLCVCGKHLNEAKHTMGTTVVSDGTKGHHFTCTTCNFAGATVAHTPDNEWKALDNLDPNKADRYHACTCTACGAEILEAHDEVYDYTKADYEYVSCTKCSWKNTFFHSLKTWIIENDQMHYQKCANKNCTYRTPSEQHDTKGANGTCSVCGYDPNGNKYKLTYTETFEHGSITVTPSPLSDQTYVSGTTITITLVPEEGYKVNELTVNGKSVTFTNNIYTFKIEAETTIAVEFVELSRYSVTVTVDGGNGRYEIISEPAAVEGGKYLEGSSVTVKLIPDAGYVVNNVFNKLGRRLTGFTEENDYAYTFTCEEDKAYTVSFVEKHKHKDDADAAGYRDGVCDICGQNFRDIWAVLATNPTLLGLRFQSDKAKIYGDEYKFVKIPASINGYPSEMYDLTFRGGDNLVEKIMIPEGFQFIEGGKCIIIQDCSSLNTLILLNPTITTLGNSSEKKPLFNNCPNLKTLVLPAGLKTINASAFGYDKTFSLNIYYLGTADQWNSLLENSAKAASSSTSTAGWDASIAKSVIDGSKVFFYKETGGGENEWYWDSDNVTPKPWVEPARLSAVSAERAIPFKRREK